MGPLDDLLASQYGSVFQPQEQQQLAQLPPLQPQERESILRSLANVGVSGLQALGYVLDLPGRPVRAALAGQFGDILPSILDPSRAPTGEDLAKQWGLLQGEGEKGKFELRDLVGPAVEIATNPTTFFNPVAPLVGGARTAAGQTAAKVGRLLKPVGATTADLAAEAAATGKLAPTLASRIASGQGALFEAGVPFGPKVQFGTGPLAQSVAEKIGGAYGTIGASPVGRGFKALFNRNAEGLTDKFLQPISIEANEAAAARLPEARGQIYDLARTLGPDMGASELAAYQQQLAAKGLPATYIKTHNDVLRAINEGVLDPIQGTKLGHFGSELSDLGDYIPIRQEARGVKVNPLDYYAPRELNPIYADSATGARPSSARPQLPSETAQLARKVPDEYVLGKTLGLQAMSTDQDVAAALHAGKSEKQITDTILQKYMGVTPTDVQRYDVLSQIPLKLRSQAIVDELNTLAPKVTDAQKLTSIMGKLDPEKVAQGTPYFNPDYLGTFMKRVESGVKVEERAGSVINGLNRVAGTAQQLGPNSVPLHEVLRKNGFGDMALNLVKDPNAHVPAEAADAVGRYVQSFTRPESVAPLVQAYDGFTNLFKTGVSTIFPASRARDAWQNVFMNFVKGNRDTRYSAMNPLSYYRPYEDAYRTFVNGGIVADANKIPEVIKALGPNATPEQATKFVADRAASFGLITPGQSGAATVKAGQLSTHAPGFALPGEPAPSILGAYKEGTWNPLDVARVGGRTETTFKGGLAGVRATERVDVLGRGAAFYAQLRQGASFEEAARAATEAMYDYGNLTKAERAIGQRVIPFYSFMRQNLPAQIEEMIKNPGGALAQSTRLTNSLRRDQGFIPENVGEGLAIPIGTDEGTGRTSYLTHFGLPFEEATGPLAPSFKQTFQNLIGQANPLIKTPIELAAGKSMFTGKPLQPDESFLANAAFSPLERIMRQGRNVAGAFTDPTSIPRTALELATPVHVREANVPGAERAAEREGITQLLAGNPAIRQFTNLSVRPQDLATLSPRDRLLLQLYQSMNSRKRQAVQ